MEKKLTITEISETLVRITCKDGKVYDTRTQRTYSEVECNKDDIHYFKGV